MRGQRTLRVPAVVYEVCWERLGLGVMPYPLVVFQHGDDVEQRAHARAWAADWLARHGLGEDLAAALHVVADHEIELALVHIDRDGQSRVGCFRRGGVALRVVLRDDTVELTWLGDVSLPSAAVAALPVRGAGRGQSVQVPAEALAKSGVGWQRSGMISDGVGPLMAAGADRLQAQRFLTIYSAAAEMGQASAIRPVPGRSASVSLAQVSWLDTPEGRYVSSVRSGYLTVAPVTPSALATRFAELMTGSFA
ncbi:ESX secretion-associated protein EspG [Allokutzneria oryzae]|uniref:ESX secretion-associated protein EspG n=1 Tax=Allokutzneria oryzae TaxID=1378989 RepID=A0ABV6A6S8_9PSEU